MKSYKSRCLYDSFKRIRKSNHRWVICFNMVKETMDDVDYAVYKEMIISYYPSYEKIVSSLIRDKYSVDDEIAISRQKEVKPEEWSQYYDFCEEMKIQARLIIDEFEKMIIE